MTETAQVARDEEAYWHLAKAFVRVLMVETSEALKDSGVNDAGLRQRIASRLGFGLGNFFDQYWLEAQGRRYYPVLAFSEQPIVDVDSLADAGEIQVPAPGVELHAMADDEARWFFTEQKENGDSVPMGLAGE